MGASGPAMGWEHPFDILAAERILAEEHNLAVVHILVDQLIKCLNKTKTNLADLWVDDSSSAILSKR